MNQCFMLRGYVGLQILLFSTHVFAQNGTGASASASNISSLPATTVLLLGDEDACQYTHPNQPFDDPNPLFNGTQGRYPVSSNPIPEGYPTPLTTGLCGVGLTPDDLTPSTSITITQDGTTIDGLDVAGRIQIRANNVTIRNTRITSSSTYALQLQSGFSDLLVEDTRIRSTGNATSSAVQVANGATFRRVHITGGSDNLKSNSGDLTVTDSYLAATYRSPGSHNDVVQIRNGSNYSFTHNTMLGPWQMSTSVFIIQAKAGAGGGPISNVTISDNYLSGGGYTAYTTSPDFPMTNVEITANVFELDSWQHGYKSNPANANWHDNYDSNSTQLD